MKKGKLKVLSVIFTALVLADLITTKIGLGIGLSEGFWLAGNLISRGLWKLLAIVKLIPVIFVLYVAWNNKDINERFEDWFDFLLLVFVIMFCVIVFSNLKLIFGVIG